MERGGDGASECEGEGESERARYSGTGNYPVFFLRSWLAYLVLQLVDKKQRVFNFFRTIHLVSAPPCLPKWGGEKGNLQVKLLPPPGGRPGWGQIETSPNGEERKVNYKLHSFPHLGEGRDGGK